MNEKIYIKDYLNLLLGHNIDWKCLDFKKRRSITCSFRKSRTQTRIKGFSAEPSFLENL